MDGSVVFASWRQVIVRIHNTRTRRTELSTGTSKISFTRYSQLLSEFDVLDSCNPTSNVHIV